MAQKGNEVTEIIKVTALVLIKIIVTILDKKKKKNLRSKKSLLNPKVKCCQLMQEVFMCLHLK
jgi:predicted transposase YbfD/YdcC